MDPVVVMSTTDHAELMRVVEERLRAALPQTPEHEHAG
jgi:hypothetical protein